MFWFKNVSREKERKISNFLDGQKDLLESKKGNLPKVITMGNDM